MKVAYILNTYPQPSQSFIRRELKGLERLGLSVERIAMRRGDVPLKDPQDRAEQGRTQYVLEAGKGALLMSLLAAMLGRPGAFFAALKGALRTFDRGYKSSNLALMVELLAGPLVGAAHMNKLAAKNWGNIVIALNPYPRRGGGSHPGLAARSYLRCSLLATSLSALTSPAP